MKIAVISDIHANLEALKTVLEDIKEQKCDRIFCLGDLAMAGPQINEAIEFFREKSDDENFEIIAGNTDKMLCSDETDQIVENLAKTNEIMKNAYIADICELKDENKEFLKTLEIQKEIKVGNLKILLVHGSPRKIDENISSDLKIEEVEEILEETDCDIVFCGHTHVPCGFQTNKKQTIVNVGSVGRPFSQKPESCFCIFEIEDPYMKKFLIEHVFVKYDVEKASKILENRNFEGACKLAKMLICATSRYPK